MKKHLQKKKIMFAWRAGTNEVHSHMCYTAHLSFSKKQWGNDMWVSS